MLQRKPPANSIAALGLQRFMSERYPLYGGYVKLNQMFDAGANNAEIGRAFGPPDRPITKEAVRPWRERWELENKHPELRQGGTLEDLEEATDAAA